MHYQPKVDCINGRLVGFEALVRWPRSHDAWIMPDRFIPFAEQHGLIDELAAVVLDQALGWFGPRFVAAHTAAYIAPVHYGFADISLSINLSASSLRDMRVVEDSAAACLRHGVPTAKVIFELTETSAMDSPMDALTALTPLAASRAFNSRSMISGWAIPRCSSSSGCRLPKSKSTNRS